MPALDHSHVPLIVCFTIQFGLNLSYFIAVLWQFANFFIKPTPSPTQNVSMDPYVDRVCIEASSSGLAGTDTRIHRSCQNQLPLA
jgi:hypothetical protein